MSEAEQIQRAIESEEESRRKQMKKERDYDPWTDTVSMNGLSVASWECVPNIWNLDDWEGGQQRFPEPVEKPVGFGVSNEDAKEATVKKEATDKEAPKFGEPGYEPVLTGGEYAVKRPSKREVDHDDCDCGEGTKDNGAGSSKDGGDKEDTSEGAQSEPKSKRYPYAKAKAVPKMVRCTWTCNARGVQRCQVCGEKVNRGNRIGHTEKGWAHIKCAEKYVSEYYPNVN